MSAQNKPSRMASATPARFCAAEEDAKAMSASCISHSLKAHGKRAYSRDRKLTLEG